MNKPNNGNSSPGVTLVLNSENAKLGANVAATYVSQASCPKTCPFIDEGCYAETGNTGIHTRRLNTSQADPEQLASAEALLIAKSGNWDRDKALRLHVVGDSKFAYTTRIISKAVAEWWPGNVWSYTHAWRKVARRHWRTISVLASCESWTDAVLAMSRGYAAAVVVAQHPANGKAFQIMDTKVIPCPNQTRGITCRDCQLCWKDQWLLETRTVISFEAHGSQKNRVKQALVNIQSGK